MVGGGVGESREVHMRSHRETSVAARKLAGFIASCEHPWALRVMTHRPLVVKLGVQTLSDRNRKKIPAYYGASMIRLPEALPNPAEDKQIDTYFGSLCLGSLVQVAATSQIRMYLYNHSDH